MNISKQSNVLVQASLAALLVTLLIAGLSSSLWSAEPASGSPPPAQPSAPGKTNSVNSKGTPPDAAKTGVKRQLSGAELYSMHCNRCHPERYPTERTAAQWKTIVLHMEVRANLPRSQAQLILKYLQDNSGR
jgi:hypothetical protein